MAIKIGPSFYALSIHASMAGFLEVIRNYIIYKQIRVLLLSHYSLYVLVDMILRFDLRQNFKRELKDRNRIAAACKIHYALKCCL